MKNLMKLLSLIFLVFISQNTFAQEEECAKEFNEISKKCISSNISNLKDKPFFLSTVEVGDILLFQTSAKNLGKLRVKAVFESGKECILFYDAITFQNSKAHSPPNQLRIQEAFNEWSNVKLNLDTNDLLADISLTRNTKDKKCVVSTENAYFFKLRNEGNNLIDESNLLFYAAVILIGLAVYFVANTVFAEEDKFQAQEKLEDAETEVVKKSNEGFILKYSKPFFKRYFSPIVKGMKNKRKFRDKYKRPLANAGLTKDLTPEDFFAFKLFLILGFPIVFLMARTFLEETWPLSIIPVLCVVGYFYPDIWIGGKKKNRQEDIILNMPFIVDMLALSVEAGLDFVAAMQRVIEKAPPSPLAEEFETMIREIKLGSSRAEALRQLAWRTDVLAISSFTATLIAADQVGASIGPILKTLSAEIRQKRSSDAEKKGATAATKILIPMMIFILPAVMMIIMAPVVMQLF